MFFKISLEVQGSGITLAKLGQSIGVYSKQGMCEVKTGTRKFLLVSCTEASCRDKNEL